MKNGCILIENYEVTTCHGVNPEEKVEPQRFLISAKLSLDVSTAAKTDDIDKTVSYSAVCKLIKAFFLQESRNLLEYLALNTAKLILKKYPVCAVEVTVKKPDAPMKGVFDWVGVTATVKRSTAYLSMGSNMGDREAYMNNAVQLLADNDDVFSVVESKRIATEPYGGVAKGEFVNSALKVETCLTADELLDLIHDIEKECGRVRKERWGDRTLDIDILFFDDEVRGEGDLILPHPDMENRDFVLKPLAEIAPYVVHTLMGKRVLQMLKELKAQR